MIANAIVMFFYDVNGQPILHLSYYNTSFFKNPLLLTILVISIVQIVCAYWCYNRASDAAACGLSGTGIFRRSS